MLHILLGLLAFLPCTFAQDLFLASRSNGSSRPVVSTECGDVLGVRTGSVNTFKGIHYAVADRWKPPRSLKSAGGCWAPKSFDASSIGPACVSLIGLAKSAQDCLTLTVWTPANFQDELLDPRPSMVYFHGGDLTMGEVGAPFDKVAAHGKGLVVVDVSYRLNLAGFLSIDAMAEESPMNTSGAFGFLDMIESLQWVKRNIAAFGGNPSKVTIFGQSSGGTAVMVLVGSPLATGLFSGAMSLSGSPNISMSAAVQRRQHQHMVKSAGCASGTAAEVMECLRAESVNLLGRLYLAEPKLGDHAPGTEDSPSWLMDNIFDLPRHRDGLRAPGLAVVDGYVLREPVTEAYAHVRNDVPVIFSSMAQECGGRPGNMLGPVQNVSALSVDEFAKYLIDAFAYVNSSFGAQVADLYAPIARQSTQLAFDTIAADISMTCGNLALSQAAGQSFKRSPVYLVYNEMYENKFKWAEHGYDLNLACNGDGPSAVSLRDAWYEFASTGRVSKWSPITASKPWVTNLLQNGGEHAAIGWKQQECAFWKSAQFGPEFWWSN